MTKSHYKARIALTFIKCLDIVLVLALFVCIREYIIFGHIVDRSTFYRIECTPRHFVALILLSLVWNRTLTYMRMYRFRQVEGWGKRLWQGAIAFSLGVATILFGAELTGIGGIKGPFPFVFWVVTLIVFTIYRSIIYGILYWVRTRRRNIRNVVIVGLNKRSLALSNSLSKPELGFKVLGFVDDESGQQFNCQDLNKPYLCSLTQFNHYVSNKPVDVVFLALPIRSHYDEISRIIEACATQGIQTRFMADLFDFSFNIPQRVDPNSPASYINYGAETHTEFQLDLKRFFDVAVSSAALIILLPVFLIVALIIFIDDGLPVFFIQERIGLNKRRYKIFKFRSMIRGAEKIQASLENLNETSGAVFKITNDPRITRVGNYLRKTSLDELPQLVNVFLGSMSLVGPRPLPVRDFELFYDDSHRRRFSVKPGITGLWQVSGRNEIDFEEWMKLDLQYIANWSFLLDFKIILRTIPAVLTGKGAK